MGAFSSTMRWAPFAPHHPLHDKNKKSLTAGRYDRSRGRSSLRNNNRKTRRCHSSDNWMDRGSKRDNHRRKKRSGLSSRSLSGVEQNIIMMELSDQSSTNNSNINSQQQQMRGSSTSSLIMGSAAPLLYEQALVGNWEELMKRIKTHPTEAQYVDKCRNMAIHLACRRQPPAEVIAALLRASSSSPTTQATMDGLTPLHFAAYCGANTQVIQILLQELHHHSSLSSSNSPLNSFSTITSTIHPPQSFQSSPQSQTPLERLNSNSFSSSSNHSSSGGGSFLMDRRGRTPLHCVCAGFRTAHRPEVVRLLLQSHPWSALQADERHRTPFTLMMDDYAEEIDDALLSSSSQNQLWQTRILPPKGELHECWNILLLLLHAAHLGTVPSSLIPPHRHPSPNTSNQQPQIFKNNNSNPALSTSSNNKAMYLHDKRNNVSVGQLFNQMNTKNNIDAKPHTTTDTSMETKVDISSTSSVAASAAAARIFPTQISSNSLLLHHSNNSNHLSSSLSIMDNYEVDLNNAPFRPVHAIAACAGSDPHFPSGLVKLILKLYAPLGGAKEEDEELNLPLHIAVRSQMYHPPYDTHHHNTSYNHNYSSSSTIIHSNKWNQFSLNNSSTDINNLSTTHNNQTITDVYNADSRQKQPYTFHHFKKEHNRQHQHSRINDKNKNHNRQSVYDPTSTTIIVTTKKEQYSQQSINTNKKNKNTNNKNTIIEDLIQLCPHAASIRDETGKYPLFLAIETGKPWEHGVEPIFKAFPDAFKFHASSLQATFMSTLSHPNQNIRDETARTLGHIFRNWPILTSKINRHFPNSSNKKNPTSTTEDMKLADHDCNPNDYSRNYTSIQSNVVDDKEEEVVEEENEDDDFGFTTPYNHFGHELERPNADHFIISLIEMSMNNSTTKSINYPPSSNRSISLSTLESINSSIILDNNNMIESTNKNNTNNVLNNATIQIKVSMLQALYSALSNVPKEAIQVPDTPDKALMSCIELLRYHPDETVRDSAARVIGSAITLLPATKAIELLHTLIPIDNNSDGTSPQTPKNQLSDTKCSDSISSLEIDTVDEEECKDINIILHGRAAACYRILSSPVCEKIVGIEEEKTYFHHLALMVKDWMVDADEVMVRKAACLAIGPMLGYGLIHLKEIKHTIMKCMRAIEDAEVHIFLARGLMVAARQKQKLFICKNGIPILDCALMLAMSAPVAVQKMFHGFLWIALGFEQNENTLSAKSFELKNGLNRGFMSEYMSLAEGENGTIMMSLVTKTLSNIVSVNDVW